MLTGAGGLLGRRLAAIATKDFEAFLHYHQPPANNKKGKAFCGDLGSSEHVKKLASQITPEIIINCAAYADVDGCETDPEKSSNINVTGVKNLLHAFPDAKFVQISTDYVFGDDDIRGSNPPKPDDKPRPVNVYGRHKLEAEQATLSLSPDNLVVRVNTLYDHTDQRNFFRLVYDNLTAGRSVIGLTDQFSNPISAFGAAELIIRLIEKKAVGIFHLGGNEFVSRCDLALRIAKFFNLNESLFDRATSDALQRPAIRLRFAGLDCQTTGLFLKTSMPSLDEDFIRIREELRDAAF